MKRIIVTGLFSGMALVPALAGAQISDVTYSGEVAEIMRANCQICHQEGNIGPFPLTTYAEVRPLAGLIREQVISREMPPYHYDKDIGIQELKNDWRMSDEDINTVVAWIDAGVPEGNPADLPEQIQYPEIGEWRLETELGPPDHVIKSAKWNVPANGQDLWWNPEVPTGITEDRCIKAIETLP